MPANAPSLSRGTESSYGAPGRELKVVNACGRAGVYLHEKEGEFQIVDCNEQPIGSFAVSVGKEIAEESGLDQVIITAPSFAVLGEADLKSLCLLARADDELSVVHVNKANTPHRYALGRLNWLAEGYARSGLARISHRLS